MCDFFWVIPGRLNFICQRFGTLCLLHLHKAGRYKETLAYKIHTPRNYPEESIRHSEHSESLKSRKIHFVTHRGTSPIANSRVRRINPLNPELNPICYLLALLGAHHFLHVSRIRVKLLTFKLLMSYIYGAPILDVSRSHTTTQHSR